MKSLHAIFHFSRRATLWLSALLGVVALLVTITAATMYFWVLPNIGQHRDTLASLMSAALGQRVTLHAVVGQWQQARPEFRLEGVQIYDQKGQPALYLPSLDATFAWRSLLLLELRFNRIELRGLSLNARRAQDGRFYIGGIAINPGDPKGGFSDWVLQQRRIHIADATLVWHDEVRKVPPLRFDAVDFDLDNLFNRHQFRLRATPPGELATPLLFEADLRSRKRSGKQVWSGPIKGTVAGLSFPELAQWLPEVQLPQSGRGAFNLVLRLVDGRMESLAAGFNLGGVAATLGEDRPELRLDRVKGSAVWKHEPQGQRIDFAKVQFSRPGTDLTKPFDAGLAWGVLGRRISASNLDLAIWPDMLASLPIPEAMRKEFVSLGPRGRLDSLQFSWKGGHPSPQDFSIDARFSGLGLVAQGSRPGVANLSGMVRGDAAGGVFELAGQAMALDMPALFRDPRIAIDTLQARGSWKPTAQGYLFKLDEAQFANADAAGQAAGQYEYIAGQRGIIDLSAQLTRADGTRVYRYMPTNLSDDTVNWVRDGVIKAAANDVKLTLKGDLKDFPFDGDRDGQFRVEVPISDGVLDYANGWPRIDGIAAQLIFHGKRMDLQARQARIYNTALLPVRVAIPDLDAHEHVLEIEGEANGPIQDFIRFTNFSPVGEHLIGLTEALDGNGPARLALKMKVPLEHSQDASVAGRLRLANNTLFPPGMPRLERVTGDIHFTEQSVGTQGVTAQYLGGPLQISAATRDGQVEVLTRGQVSAAGLAPWLGSTWSRHLWGQAPWRGQIVIGRDGSRVQLESELVGLGSSLPVPLRKSPQQPMPLLVRLDPQQSGRQWEVQLGRIIGAVWRTRGESQFDRGEVRFGGAAQLPAEPGLRLAGQASGLGLGDWMAMLPEKDRGEGLPVSSIDLTLANLDLMGRRFSDVRLQGRNRNGLLRTSINADGIAGNVTYRPAGEQPARLSAQFKHLTIPPASAAGGSASSGGLGVGDVPVLDVVVEDFRLEAQPLGRLEAIAHGSPQGLVIDSLQLSHDDSVLKLNGVWRKYGQGDTRANLQLDVIDAGKMLSRFGFKDAMRRGAATFKGDVTWEGAPADFSFHTLAGTLDFQASRGQFLKVDPGAAKLLGVLSLQSLPRRLSFDFRDIFSDGFAFDEISATMRIAQGVVYSDNFQMLGPAAKVNMSGMANLGAESVQLRLKVFPKLSEGVAVAGALIAGPLAGVGAYAAQKILRDPIEEASSREYIVSGPWAEPDVQRLTKPKTEFRQAE
jgi:uncharacterized protein (TIGR02099 family)